MGVYILTQNKQALWNFDDISRLHITASGRAIQAVGKNGSGGEIAKYNSREQCAYVMDMFISAIEAGDITFTFPTEISLEHAKQHTSSGGGSKRHGGS